MNVKSYVSVNWEINSILSGVKDNEISRKKLTTIVKNIENTHLYGFESL